MHIYIKFLVKWKNIVNVNFRRLSRFFIQGRGYDQDSVGMLFSWWSVASKEERRALGTIAW